MHADFFDKLNSRQTEAVKATEGYVRVIAGAGSGKTKVLVSRYAYLVKELGIDSANILCVTFTNKAAAEMKRRIRDLIGPEHDTSLICTYHGFCARLIREDPEKLFLTKDFQILDTSQQKNILADIYQKYELKLDYASFERIMKEINEFKSDLDYVPRFCSTAQCQINKNVNSQNDLIIEDYLQRQKAIYGLDFNDLISFAQYMLREFADVREKWQERLNYILVDEFQDSSKREMKLLDALSAQYKNLMIVGDPDQNIYEWRGSDVKLLVNFEQSHDNTQTIFLNQNYRSTPQILKCANALIDHNELRIKKDLFTEAGNGAAVTHYHSKSDEKENETIVDNIQKLVKEKNYCYSDVAVLYRAGFLSRSIEKKLSESGIPYEIIGGVKFFQRMEVMDVIAYLKLIAIDDDASLKRIINVPRRRFGRVKMARLEALQEEMNASSENGYSYSLFEVLKDNLDDKTLKSSDAGDFVNLIRSMRNKMFISDISEMINSLMEESGYEEYIRELGDEERLDNLTEFKRFSNEYEKRFGESLTLTEFLQNIALQSDADEDDNRDAVKLMTIHAAKGLEFPIVFIVGLSESIFPNPKSIELRKLEGLEEERRLCYVAITRAMDYLFLMDSEGISEKGSVKRPSRFLQEIGEDNYKRIGIINKDLITDVTSYERASQGGSTKMINIGDKIEHHIFGRGIVSGISGKNGSYVVRFDKLPQPRNISESYFEDKAERLESPENDVPEEIADESQEEPLEEVFNHIHPITSEAEKSDNLWKRDDVPHSGWICTGITDLGKPIGICEMCGHQIIRYVHHMSHPQYRPLNVGCVCAGKMEGDIEGAQKRERDFKNRQQRKQSFMRKPWKRSSRGNLYMKIKGHLLVIYEVKNGTGWKYSLDHVFCEILYPSRRAAVDAAFEAIEKVTKVSAKADM